MENTTDSPRALSASDLFAVGDVFTFVGDRHHARWEVVSNEDGYIKLDNPSTGRLKGPLLIASERLSIGLAEDRARRVYSANTWIMDGTMPDDLVSVLICDSCGEVGEGFHDEGWRWACAALIDGPIRAWAHLPEGPEPSEEGASKS